MTILTSDLRLQRHRLGRAGQAQLRFALAYTRSVHLNLRMLEAVASRETGMLNILGDGGHGRGAFQLDDRYQEHFLRTHVGCRPYTNVPVYASAWPKGRVPTLFAGTVHCVRILEANVAEAKRLGVAVGKRMEFAFAAYNAGVGGAARGWREGDVDKYTANGNYSADVIDRYHALKIL